MFGEIAIKIRVATMALVAVLSGFGILPAGLEDVLAENVDKVIGGLAGGWAIFAFFTGRAVRKTE